MNNPSVLILDPRGNIAAGGKDVITRHETYAKELLAQGKTSRLDLKVFSAGVSIQSSSKGKNERVITILFLPLAEYFTDEPALNTLRSKREVFPCVNNSFA